MRCLTYPQPTPKPSLTGLAVSVVSGDSLLTSLHAARAVGIVGRPRQPLSSRKGKKGKGKARAALVLDFDEAEGHGGGGSSSSSSKKARKKGKGKGKGSTGLAWFLAPTPHQQHQHQQQQQQHPQQQHEEEGRGQRQKKPRRARMADYFPEHVPTLAAKYDLCAGGPALQAALAHGGGIGRRCGRGGWVLAGVCVCVCVCVCVYVWTGWGSGLWLGVVSYACVWIGCRRCVT
jgi:hypothetical protein